MNFPDEKISAYAERFTKPESEVLSELNRETNAKVLMPQMLSGKLQGRVLAMISQMVRPSRILEIGTYTGYSAICLSEGLVEGGMIHTIDNNEELKEMVMAYFERAGITNKIKFHLGRGEDIIPGINESFDLVFIDADKRNYSRYFDLTIEKVRRGGYIIADNVLWSGKILEEETAMDKDTQALYEYSKKVFSDPRVETLLLPVRDGLMIARKL